MRIGIMGGTFDPPHLGHFALAEHFMCRIPLDQVILMPDASPVHKPSAGVTPASWRLAMCKAAVKGRSGFSVSDYELRQDKPSYTVYTLREMKVRHPGWEIYFICGGDMFVTLPYWYRYGELLSLAVFCATARGDGLAAVEETACRVIGDGGRCVISPYQPPAISSTLVRTRVRSGEQISALVPSAVEDYIIRNCLYH